MDVLQESFHICTCLLKGLQFTSWKIFSPYTSMYPKLQYSNIAAQPKFSNGSLGQPKFHYIAENALFTKPQKISYLGNP